MYELSALQNVNLLKCNSSLCPSHLYLSSAEGSNVQAVQKAYSFCKKQLLLGLTKAKQQIEKSTAPLSSKLFVVTLIRIFKKFFPMGCVKIFFSLFFFNVNGFQLLGKNQNNIRIGLNHTCSLRDAQIIIIQKPQSSLFFSFLFSYLQVLPSFPLSSVPVFSFVTTISSSSVPLMSVTPVS